MLNSLLKKKAVHLICFKINQDKTRKILLIRNNNNNKKRIKNIKKVETLKESLIKKNTSNIHAYRGKNKERKGKIFGCCQGHV